MSISMQTSRDVSLFFVLVGALNWGVTAVTMLAQSPYAHPPPDIFHLLLEDADEVLLPVQIFVYAVVFFSGLFYSLSHLLPRMFPSLE